MFNLIWNISGLEAHLQDEFDVTIPVAQMLEDDASLHEESLRDAIFIKPATRSEAKIRIKSSSNDK
jgi:preprotein translocase subunit SecA